MSHLPAPPESRVLIEGLSKDIVDSVPIDNRFDAIGLALSLLAFLIVSFIAGMFAAAWLIG